MEFDLLSKMLAKNPVKRASIMDIWQHPWMQTKPKRKKYFALSCPIDSSDSDMEEEEEEEDESFMGLKRVTRNNKWKKTPLTVITEDSEIKEYS